VVVGAGLGGLRSAEQLRAHGYDGPVTVVGREVHPPYNRTPLSKEALREIDSTGVETWLDRLAFRMRPSVDDVEWRLGRHVVAADLDERVLELDDGSRLGYAGLVVATGLRPHYLPFPTPSEGRFRLRTLEDAARLRAALRPGARVAVVGGGFIGSELAATATQLGCQVTVVEPRATVMATGLGEQVGRLVQEYLVSHGVQVRTGRLVEALVGSADDADRVAGVELDDGDVLAADVVVEAVGARPNVEWLEGNGLDLSDGVLCDAGLAVAGRPEVVAVGDVARFPNPRFDGVPRRVEHWSMPTDTAKHAAPSLLAALCGDDSPRPPFAPLPSFWSDQLDLRIQSFGEPGLADRVEVVVGKPHPAKLTDGLVAHYHRGDRLVGSVLFNIGGRAIREQRDLVDRACPPPPSDGLTPEVAGRAG
jgi:NADPH-dependent 2,4-dienoyl-CoA reductase/sulfur reductase-like enzyme